MRRRFVTLVLLAAACATPAPRAIVYDADACAECRMQISDRRFGAEIVTRTGKVVEFDAVECLLDYERRVGGADIQSVWVTDFRRPATLVPAERARFVQVPGGKSPMGRGILATATDEGARDLRSKYGGAVKQWSELQ